MNEQLSYREGSMIRIHRIGKNLLGAAIALMIVTAARAAHAAPMSVGGQTALALGALVAGHSPSLGSVQKRTIQRIFNGDQTGPFPTTQPITVQADSILCRVSNVQIAVRSCVLTFGSHSHKLTGRAAHELYATLVEVGNPSSGAAGTIFESLAQLSCTIDPQALKQSGGGGASCTFTPTP
jgi:hypothetical protein